MYPEIRSNGCEESVSVEELSITPNKFFINHSINIRTYIHLYINVHLEVLVVVLDWSIGDAATIEM